MKSPTTMKLGCALAGMLALIVTSAQGALITQYNFEGDGTDSVGTRNLALSGAAAFSTNTPDGSAKALKFNGSVNEATYDVVGSDAVTGSFTVMAYVNYSEFGLGVTGDYFFGTRGPSELSFDAALRNGNQIHSDIGTGTGWLNTSANALFSANVNTWYNIAYVVSPGAYTIYADGNQVGSGTFGAGIPLLFNSTHDIAIGEVSAGGGEGIHGIMDNVRIYDTALTQAEVRAALVPEPSSALLMFGSGAMLLLRRRRASALSAVSNS